MEPCRHQRSGDGSTRTKPTKDIETVFKEWDAFHKPIRAVMKSATGSGAEETLRGNHGHLRIHIGIIEELLRKFGE